MAGETGGGTGRDHFPSGLHKFHFLGGARGTHQWRRQKSSASSACYADIGVLYKMPVPAKECGTESEVKANLLLISQESEGIAEASLDSFIHTWVNKKCF